MYLKKFQDLIKIILNENKNKIKELKSKKFQHIKVPGELYFHSN
jgi:hypothetical protein